MACSIVEEMRSSLSAVRLGWGTSGWSRFWYRFVTPENITSPVPVACEASWLGQGDLKSFARASAPW